MRETVEGLYKVLDGVDDDSIVAFLLKTVSLIYSFMATCTVPFENAVLVHVPQGIAVKEFIDFIKGHGIPPIRRIGEPSKSFESALKIPEYGVLVFEFSCTRYTAENLERVIDFCKTNALNAAIQPLVLIITDRELPEQYMEKFAGSIYLNGLLPDFFSYESDFTRVLIEAVAQNQKFIRSRMTHLDDEDPGIIVFKSAAVCVRTVLEVEGFDEKEIRDFSDLMNAGIEQIRSSWDCADNPEYAIKVFRWQFISFLNRANLSMVAIDRCCVSGDELRIIESALLYDSDFYYLQDERFKQICQEGNGAINHVNMKRQLARAGVLVLEGRQRDYYTKKISVITAYGPKERERYVQLRRNLVDHDEEYSLIELIIAKGGSSDARDKTGNCTGVRAEYLPRCEQR